MSESDGAGVHRVAFVLVPDYSMIAFAAAVETLRIANRAAGAALFEWTLHTPDAAPVAASNGLVFSGLRGLEELKGDVTVFVCGGLDVQRHRNRALDAWLRRMDRAGANLGALCTGCYVLAQAGLLDGYRCTIHWENMPSFAEEFPDITVSGHLFEIDRTRFTCAGGTAVVDLILTLIALRHGRELASDVAAQLMHAPIRDQSENQRISLPARIGARHPKLVSIVASMEDNLEDPLSPASLACDAGLSTRQLERLFRRYLGRSPKRYYLELRLQRARILLLQTSMSVINVALACGFASPSHFSKCYRAFFGRTPYRERGGPIPAAPASAAAPTLDDRATG